MTPNQSKSFSSTDRTESTARRKHGCCADKACNDRTCMELPAGKTCGDCVHLHRCVAIFGHTPTDTSCDWFPRRFHERAEKKATA